MSPLQERLRDTLAVLQTGIAGMEADAALGLIESWRERVHEFGGNDSDRVESDLETLRGLITEGPRDRDDVGRAVAQLGRSLLATAPDLSDPAVGMLLERIGNLLLHSGHALRGPLPSTTPSPS